MRVVVERNAVRCDPDEAVESAAEAFHGLFRQAIDQIGIDRLEIRTAALRNCLFHHLKRLYPIDGLLHLGVEILHAEAVAIEPQSGEHRERAVAHRARIDFNPKFGVGGELEMTAQHAHQLVQFVRIEKGRRPSAKVKLHRFAIVTEVRRNQRHFLVEIAQIFPARDRGPG